MTRLTEALARAGEADKGTTEPAIAPDDASAVVPRAWHFDADDAPVRSSPPAPTQSTLERVEVAKEPVNKARDVADVVDDARGALPANDTLVVGPNPNNTLVEQYRHLAAALHHAALRTGAKTVMVVSAVEAEGKTTTAANIALTLSESHQRRVLLIDADLRRPSIHELFQLSNHHGLSDTLRDVAPGARVPIHKFSPTLSIITAGRPTQDPMSALVSDMMKGFLAEAAEQYDWVIIDTPPVALLSDANLLAAMVDLAILVVGANATPFPLVKRAVDALGPSKILGVVLNRAERSELAAGYGYYGYGYGYSYGDARRTKKKAWSLPFRKGR